MKLRGPPLWLICDVICWLGVWATFVGFSHSLNNAVSRMLAEKRREFEPSTFAFLALEEAGRSFAIARQAFRLVRALRPTPAGTAPITTTTIIIIAAPIRARATHHSRPHVRARAPPLRPLAPTQPTSPGKRRLPRPQPFARSRKFSAPGPLRLKKEITFFHARGGNAARTEKKESLPHAYL